MNDAAMRIVAVGLILGVALLITWAARRRADRTGSPVDVGGLTQGRAAVVFTKDECQTCDRTLERIRRLDIPIHQVRAEDDPEALEARAITGVPVTVIVDEQGRTTGRFRGLPPHRALRRAVKRAR